MILSYTANPTNLVTKGGSITFQVDAIDEDGETLKYSWSATGGTLSTTSGRIVSWFPPDKAGTYTVQVTVSDGKGGSGEGAQNLVVRDDGTAGTVGGGVVSQPSTSPIQSQAPAPPTASVGLDATWTKVTVPFLPNALHAVSPDNAWIVGDDGKAAYTTNGGKQWQTVGVSKTALTTVSFVNQSIGFVAGSGGLLFKTADGGQNWEMIDLAAQFQHPNVNAMGFKDALEGLMETGAGILASSDGGRTWKKEADPPISGVASIIDPNRQVQYFADGSAWTLNMRRSGGIWTDMPEGPFNSILMLTASSGFASKIDSVWQTTDGGRSWSRSPRLRGAGEVFQVNFASFAAVPGSGRVEIFSSAGNLISDDSGSTWRKRPGQGPVGLIRAWLFAGDAGWAIEKTGGGTRVYRLVK